MASLHDPEKHQHDVYRAFSSIANDAPKRRWMPRAIKGIICATAIYYLFQQTPLFLSKGLNTPDIYVQSDIFDWVELQPSRELEWRKCYGGKFDCARLDVPIDWLEPSDEDRVVLAIIRAPAKSRKDYKGPVFVNPGGPGGSGVSWLAEGIADHLQTIIGDNHDIVSWDPRGVGASIPRIECWESAQRRHDWSMQLSSVADSHPGMIFDAVAQFDAVSRQCETLMNASTPGLLSHISTASHARDMLEISEKMNITKIKYWGPSYGTILGGTFAALYPDRVERLVSDGNVDYHDWFGNVQLNYLQDADKIMEAFFTFCSKAGPDKCAFWEPTPEAIQKRFLALLNSLRKSPVYVAAYTNGTQLQMPELVTYSKLQNLIRGCIYKPIRHFPPLASAMAALENKDGVPYYQLRSEAAGSPPLVDQCALNETLPTIPSAPEHSADAFPAIMCADGEPIPDDATPDSFLEYSEALQRISRYAGAANVYTKLTCIGRRARPRWRYSGPFRNITTAFPILFIGNTADNVTPLLSARNNSEAFPGSVVLVQKSYGHTSLAAPSTCTAKVIREYFQEGKLPEEGTECEQDWELFEDPPSIITTGEEDGELAFAVRELSRRAKVGIW